MPRRSTTTINEPLGGGGRRLEPLAQPNDRDESSADAERIEALAPVQRRQMARAGRDAASGRPDTECRSVPAAADSPCPQPDVPDLLDTGLAPDDPRSSEAENRRNARHDPGEPAVLPTGAAARRRSGR